MRVYSYSFLTLLLLTGFATEVYSQSLIDGYLSHRVILNEAEGSVTAYVKPVDMKSVDSEKQYFWFAKGKLSSSQGGYSGKVLNGAYQSFYPSKNLRESGHFAAGLKSGRWKRWQESGVLKEEYTWSAGSKSGPYLLYDSMGRLAEKGRYTNGLLQGKKYVYTGDSTVVTHYRDGKLKEPKKLKLPAFIQKFFQKKQKAAVQP